MTPLLHMHLGPCVSPCELTGWCFSPWELWWVWIVDNFVLPMGMQTLSAPSVLSLAPSLGSPCSVRWLAESILLCIGMALAASLRRHPYHVPASKHYLASTIVHGFGGSIWIDFQVWQSLDDCFFSNHSLLQIFSTSQLILSCSLF